MPANDESDRRPLRATLVDEVVLVSDAEMLDAPQTLWREVGIADLSVAASYAVLQTHGAGMVPWTHVCALGCSAGSDGVDPVEKT